MDQRERFVNTLLFKPVDRVPNFDYWYMDGVMEDWHEEGMPVEVNLDNADDYFGLDVRRQMCILPTNTTMPSPPFPEEIIEDSSEYEVKMWFDGIKRKSLKSRDYIQQDMAFPVETVDDFKMIIKRFDPHSPERYPPAWKEKVADHRNRGLPLGLHLDGFFARARAWMGTENACMGYHLDPELMRAIGSFWADFNIEVSKKALAEHAVDFVQFFEDMAYKTGPLVSPLCFREFMMPYYIKVVDFIKSQGVPLVLVDSDGHINELVPLFIECGLNAIYPLEVQAGADPLDFGKEFGSKIAMLGGIDKRVLLRDHEAVEAELRAKIPVLTDQGGYIPTTDHRVPRGTPLSNWLFYVGLKRELIFASSK